MKTVALDVEIASSYEKGSICALGLCTIENGAHSTGILYALQPSNAV